MSVVLSRPKSLPSDSSYEQWAVIGTPVSELDAARHLPGLEEALEHAFEEVAEMWWKIGSELSAEPTAEQGHTPACTANLSDFGLMLAWSRLVVRWASEHRTILVVTDDPWMFRHLSRLEGVVAGPAPALRLAEFRLFVRGYAARVSAALRFARSAIRMGRQRSVFPSGATTILTYGHPTSTPEGQDGYFGGMMKEFPSIKRLLHIDCPPARAEMLITDGRTHSLHSWGNPLAALGLIWARWRPSAAWRRHDAAWLIRRAARREGGTASGAAICWQQHCQQRWLHAVRPDTVAWPWENHSWERVFARACRAAGVATVGYQHSVIGPLMLNYSPASVKDGLGGLPDRILTAGEVPASQLRVWGIPADIIDVGGAWRIAREAPVTFEEDAPIFVPLPFDGRVAAEMVAAVKNVPDRQFLVKEHPMTPFGFTETAHLCRTDRPLGEHVSLAAVIYAATTVGLESLLAGIPTFRFRPRSCMAIDVLPADQGVGVVDADSIGEALQHLKPGALPEWDAFFAPVDLDLWRRYLNVET